ARLMTGWTIDSKNGITTFRPRLAEPGSHTLLGKSFGGEKPQAANLDLALDMLASHPATARHIATKLATHFINDDPPPEAVARLETKFIDTGGDLTQVYLTLASLPEARGPTGAKARTGRDFLIAGLRAANISQEKLAEIPEGKKVSPLVVGA